MQFGLDASSEEIVLLSLNKERKERAMHEMVG